MFFTKKKYNINFELTQLNAAFRGFIKNVNKLIKTHQITWDLG